MVDSARAAATSSLGRDGMLQSVAFAAERLLLASGWRETVDEVLESLALAAGVSRAYVVENGADQDGRLTSTWIAEWCAPGVARVMDDEGFRTAPWRESGFGRWTEILGDGVVVRGAVADFPESERSPLERHGVVSLVSLPVFVEGGWWGTIGFDDCTTVRDWAGAELDALRAAATVLGAAIQRQRSDEQARATEARYRQFVEHIPAVTYTDVVEDGVAHVGFISPQVEELLGYPRERFTQDSDFWFSIIHDDDRARVEEAGSVATNPGIPFDDEYRMIAADGRVVWVHDTSTEVTDEHGETLYWQGFLTDITDRRRTEGQLREAEQRYRELVERMPAVTYLEAVEANATRAESMPYISPQIEALVGYPVERWLEDVDFWQHVMHEEDLERVLTAVEGSNATGRPLSVDYRMVAIDGLTVWVHEEAVLIRNDEGVPAFWQGFILDITERREAEEQVRRTEARYRALVEHIPAVVYAEPAVRDGDMPFYLSPQAREIFGFDPQDWNREFWIAHIHPDDLDRVIAVDEETDRTGEPYAVEYRLRVADGSYKWIHDEAVLVGAEDGVPRFWQGVFIDITRRMQAEEQLREAELKFRTIVEHSEAIFYTQEIDPHDPTLSNTTYIAPGNTDLIGYSVEDIERDPGLWRKIIHPEDRDQVLSVDAESNTTDEDHFSMEYRMIREDGGIVWVQDEATKVQIPGRRPYWQGFLLDITERKVAEEQLARALEVEREAARRLRALDEMKNTFLQAVSHDLRTPLAAILGLAITLERGDVQLEVDDAQDLAGRIAENARRLDRLVTNLLDMDRLARGIVTPKLEPTDVGDLVRRLVAESDLIEDARLSVDVEAVVIPVDVAKIERVVENLLVNTARHTPSNAHVWVTVRALDGGALIAVEDNGVGVPAEIRDTIFEPFRQGPEAPQHSPGVGVGLTLVRRFAELHGGRAWVDEREGGGASFRVFLPGSPPGEAGG